VNSIDVPVLSRKIALRWGRDVLDHRSAFIDRGGFYTLGAAAYLDDPLEYPSVAKETNAKTQWFYALRQKVMHSLSRSLDLSVKQLQGAAEPGFHVFDAASAGMQASIHIDTPYTRVFWPEPFHSVFSFTVPLWLPEEGGLNYWVDDTMHYKRYEVGTMYLHSGLEVHQIANPVPVTNECPRITLQGHGAVLGHSNTAAVYF